jgi:hydroxymethylglutaryl-CoA lyase
VTAPLALPPAIEVREVGPRDGLQPEAPVAVAGRVRLVEALVGAGARHVELGSFVSPRAVPAMAGSAEVFAAVPSGAGLVRWALVPNLRGATDALAAGADALTVTVSVSRTYNQRNVGMDVDASVAAIADVATLAAASGVVVDAVVSCAFGSPYEGDVAPAAVAALWRRLVDVGCTRLTCADTTGMASPRRVGDLLAEVGTDVGLHLHDTRGTALVNAYAALQHGVVRFDTAVGGLGGSPFAEGAGGNLATEDLVHLCDDVGIATGIDLARLLEASALVADLVGRAVPSRVAAAGASGGGARP